MEKESAAIIDRWFLRVERLQEYRLAQKLQRQAVKGWMGTQEDKVARAEPEPGEAEQQGYSKAEGEQPLPDTTDAWLGGVRRHETPQRKRGAQIGVTSQDEGARTRNSA